MLKTTPHAFPLASQAARVALPLGVLDGNVQAQEVRAAVAQDVLPRPHRKPVVADGMHFISVTAAAKFFVQRDSYSNVSAMCKAIARKCNEDCWEGYYWAE